MEYRVLGKTGIKVSCLSLGTMTFGDTANEHECYQMFNKCRDMGISLFDCANVYADGRAEVILGKLIKDCRDKVIITTKVGQQQKDNPNAYGLSRKNIISSVNNSLRALNTEWIDIYFAHIYDSTIPIDEIVHTLNDLVQQGKILYPAVTNWSAWQIMKAISAADLIKVPSLGCVQLLYNLAKRQAEVELLPMAQSENLGVIAYNPLGGGLLTGKYSLKEHEIEGRLTKNKKYALRYGKTEYYEIADRLKIYARNCEIHPATLAIAWAVTNPIISTVLIGGNSLDQIMPSLLAISLNLKPGWREEVTGLSVEVPSPTDRDEEKLLRNK